MATSDKPPAKDSGNDEESSSALQQGDPQESGSSPDSSSSGSSPQSSATVTAREASAVGADASPTSVEKDTATNAHQNGRQPGNGDSSRTIALSYFAPTGAGRLTFTPPAGIHCETTLRIRPCVAYSDSGESVPYYTTTGERFVEHSPLEPKTASAAEQLQQGKAGDYSLVYYPPVSDSYGTALKGRVPIELPVVHQPSANASTFYTRAPLSATPYKEQLSIHPPVLPAQFVQPSPCAEYPAAITPQQRVSATGSRGVVPEVWIPQQQVYSPAVVALDSRSPQQQQEGQGTGTSLAAQKQGASTGIPVAVFGGTPRQAQYYLGSGMYPDMQSSQPYTGASQLLSEKNPSADGAFIRQQDLDAVQSSRLQQELQQFQRHNVQESALSRHGHHWTDSSPALRVSRRGHNASGRRRKRTAWDCYGELMSPRDLLPMLSDSQTRLSRRLAENLQSRRRDISRILQRIQDAVSRYYQQLTQDIISDHPRGNRYEQQQSTVGNELSKVGPDLRFIIPTTGSGVSPYVATQAYARSVGAKDPMKGQEATQLLWKDGRVLYGEGELAPELLYVSGEGLQKADQYPLKASRRAPRREEVLDIVPVSSGGGVAGKYYTVGDSALSTRACPTCGGSQVLVFTGAPTPAAVDAAAAEEEPGDGALQRLSEGDLDGCLQRLGQWRCTLCSDVAEAVDEEVLHTGGIVQQGGEWVDQVVELVVRGVAETVRSFFLMIPRPTQQVVEGYPLYEPDYTYLTRRGRPTSLTGNFCVDQLNAFLDACLVDEDDLTPPLPKAPPVPATKRTGHWLIDAANEALDKLLVERDAAAASSSPTAPGDTTPTPGSECPQCHQPLRSGVCPVQPQRGRKLKGLFEECLTPRKQAAAQRAPPIYAYEASPVGYYVPTGPKQPETEYYAPGYGTSRPGAPLASQTYGRVYYTPAPAPVQAQARIPEWVSPPIQQNNTGKADAAIASHYPYTPIYATQPCSQGFTVDAGVRSYAQPRA